MRTISGERGVRWCEEIVKGGPGFIGSSNSGGSRAGGRWRWGYGELLAWARARLCSGGHGDRYKCPGIVNGGQAQSGPSASVVTGDVNRADASSLQGAGVLKTMSGWLLRVR